MTVTVPQCLSLLVAVTKRILIIVTATTRQPAWLVDSLANLLTSRHLTLLDAVRQAGNSPITDAQKSASDFSEMCALLIQAITTGSHTVSHKSCGELLCVACSNITYTHNIRSHYCNTLNLAMEWVMQDPSGGSAHLRAVLAEQASTMIYNLFHSNKSFWQEVVEFLQPSFFFERCLFLMCRELTIQAPVDRLTQDLMVASFLGLAYLNDGNHPRTVGLMSPCLMHFFRRSLRSSLEPGVDPAMTRNMLEMLLSVADAPELGPELFLPLEQTRVIGVADEVYLEDLVRCATHDSQLTKIAFELTSRVIRSHWCGFDIKNPPSPQQISVVFPATRLLCVYALRDMQVSVDWLEGRPFAEDVLNILSLIKRNSCGSLLAVPAITCATRIGSLPGEIGLAAVAETLLRGIYHRRCVPTGLKNHEVLNIGLCILNFVFMDHRDFELDRLAVCTSLAGTLRKICNLDGNKGGEEQESTQIVSRHLMTQLQNWPERSQAWNGKVSRLLLILNSIHTASMGDMSCDIKMDRRAKTCLFLWREVVGDERAQGTVNQEVLWAKIGHKVHPNLLPGCGSWNCANFEGSSEAAIKTLLCSGCRKVRYCSVSCQKAAWTLGGHSELCERAHRVVLS